MLQIKYADHPACDLIYERVLPFYDALGVPVKAVLTHNGHEFCDNPALHPYELLLTMEGIEYRNTRVRRLHTNDLVERMNRTLLDECFQIKGRENWYLMIDKFQRDLDEFMTYYNQKHSHQSYRLNGRTPAKALQDALGIGELKNLRLETATATEISTEPEVIADTEAA